MLLVRIADSACTGHTISTVKSQENGPHLNTLNTCFLGINNNGVDVPAKNNGNC